MMVKKRWELLCLLVVGVLFLVGCDSEPTALPEVTERTQEPTVEASTSTPVATASPSEERLKVALSSVKRVDGVLAIVEGEEITWEDYEPRLHQYLYTVERQDAVEWRDPAMAQRLGSLQNDVLRQTADRVLLRHIALDQGVVVDPEALEAEIESQRNRVMSSGTFASWDAFLAYNGFTEDTFQQVVYEQLLMQAFLESQTVDTTEEQVELAHIVVESEDTAQEVLARLEAGEDFAELASEYSIDEDTKDSGGALGWFSKQMMQPELAALAFSLSPGEFGGPVSLQHGKAVIQVLGHEMREADVRVIYTRQQAAIMGLLEARRAEAEVDYLVDFATIEE